MSNWLRKWWIRRKWYNREYRLVYDGVHDYGLVERRPLQHFKRMYRQAEGRAQGGK